MPSPTKIVYGRRDYSPVNGQPITFTSWDRADNAPWGWVLGWFEDGHDLDGYQLVHVAEPSWRSAAPVMALQGKAA